MTAACFLLIKGCESTEYIMRIDVTYLEINLVQTVLFVLISTSSPSSSLFSVASCDELHTGVQDLKAVHFSKFVHMSEMSIKTVLIRLTIIVNTLENVLN